MKRFLIERYSNEQFAWEALGELKLTGKTQDGSLGKSVVEYDLEYAIKHLEKKGEEALSIRTPVAIGPIHLESWPGFAVDLLPAGSGRAYITSQNHLSDGPGADFGLLGLCAREPIGNLRVLDLAKSKNMTDSQKKAQGFSLEKITEAEASFIKELEASGEDASNFFGAGGAVPKVLMREGLDGLFYADGSLSDQKTKRLWLIKFSGSDHISDREILRGEAAIGSFLCKIGIWGAPEIEQHGDILLIKRFDRNRSKRAEIFRYGVESFYSALNVSGHGKKINLFDAVNMLYKHSSFPNEDICKFIERDALSIIFHNSDVHGRNSALIKRGKNVQLSPIYDMSPMGLHKDGIVRSLCAEWRNFEDKGFPDYSGVAKRVEADLKISGFHGDICKRLTELTGRLLKEREIFRAEISKGMKDNFFKSILYEKYDESVELLKNNLKA